MSTVDSPDLIVIGEGVAGLTAARTAAEAGLRVVSFEATLFGGLITNINHLDPSPDPAAASGADFAAALVEASIGAGVQSVSAEVSGIVARGDQLEVASAEGVYLARAVVVASGARFRLLGVPGEQAFVGRGVSNCADCDGPLFRKGEVVVAGGGDSALQEALVLAEYCERVYLVHHGARPVGRADLAARVAGQPKIQVLADSEVERIDGAKGVEQVVVRSRAGGGRRTIPCVGVFAYIGLVPNGDFLSAAFARDATGRLRAGANGETTVPGVYAAGAVRSGCGGTIEDAIADGAAAARAAIARLAA